MKHTQEFLYYFAASNESIISKNKLQITKNKLAVCKEYDFPPHKLNFYNVLAPAFTNSPKLSEPQCLHP